jgi:decaprenylphospho-beta-D-erythro-pentofuranosid-2-ulose 2-reductase
MQTVLILGATSTVAMELASIYAQRGYRLQLAARSVSRLDAFKSDLIIRYNATIELLEFDAEKAAEHKLFYDSLNIKPDIIICLFGVLGNQLEAEIDWDQAYQILNVNYIGAVSILNIVAQDLKSKRKGTIVGVSSVAGDRGRQSNFLYGSAKAGFTAYLSGLRNELFSFNVHVVTINPGFIDSRMTANLKTPGLLTAKPRKVALTIIKAVNKKSNIVYTLWMWKWIMVVIRFIPESIFKRLRL